jgi:hypothetical protein
MITLDHYFGPWKDHKDATEERRQNAILLLHACAALQYFAERDGVEFLDNPHTGNNVSGKTYGGFRPQDCPQGAPASSHKQGQGVDRYDPEGLIDAWCMNNSEVGGLLETCGIYIEHPEATPGWSHWTTRRPRSGNRVFRP